MYNGSVKRVLDIVASSVALVVLAPALVVIALAVWFRLGRPILLRQTRAGYLGTPFSLLKFRTMTNARGSNGDLLPDADRLTQFGELLRSTSLDELPELWNVLRGDMSLVGPRPLLLHYLDRYTAHQARRHDVHPGITGLAQVSGRNSLSWAEKLRLDVEYVDTYSLRLDVLILVRTLRQVVLRRDIAQPGHATAEEFMGQRDQL
jgi:lipopolysaccharide/colanic/teichoic acid biosynthesis glycosyltransferase